MRSGSRPPATTPIGVVGAGTMGVGVAQCFAEAGYPVTLHDPDPAARAAGERRLRTGLRAPRTHHRAPRAPAPASTG
ncbi:3-hydroxyacyl-CoA dehydrogenase NAD-binding domain-containing protein, partial [Streptomyces albidoflavus]|uniref:3-hydroxyacyl-CoA dehydrogenase NAD-binding domain-containing protein n=1 Tax=Streptomyces albidoflavus TaxID=1886 RepID=UPI0033BB4593